MPKTPTFYELCKPNKLESFYRSLCFGNPGYPGPQVSEQFLDLRVAKEGAPASLGERWLSQELGALYGTGLYLHLLYHRHRSEKGQSWWRLMTDVSEMVRSKNVVTSSQTMMRLDDGFSRCLWFSAQKGYVLKKCIHHRTNRQLDHGTEDQYSPSLPRMEVDLGATQDLMSATIQMNFVIKVTRSKSDGPLRELLEHHVTERAISRKNPV